LTAIAFRGWLRRDRHCIHLTDIISPAAAFHPKMLESGAGVGDEFPG
jgi:hypothetical protein